jgi:hypothetical protein
LQEQQSLTTEKAKITKEYQDLQLKYNLEHDSIAALQKDILIKSKDIVYWKECTESLEINLQNLLREKSTVQEINQQHQQAVAAKTKELEQLEQKNELLYREVLDILQAHSESSLLSRSMSTSSMLFSTSSMKNLANMSAMSFDFEKARNQSTANDVHSAMLLLIRYVLSLYILLSPLLICSDHVLLYYYTGRW